MSGGLLGRLRRFDGAAPLSVTASILAHLTELLNARQGDSAIDASYGLPDLTDFAHRVPEGVPVLQRSIADTIRRHEPRLCKVQVNAEARELAGPRLSVQFEVTAELSRGGAVRFRTEVTPCGRVRVS